MKSIKAVVLTSLVVMLAGCAGTQEYKFGKSGASEADFHRDKTQCEDEAFTVSNVFGLKYIEARNSCLQKKGWTLVAPK